MAIAGYCVHATFHVSRGEPENLLWVCHVAALLVGIGLITGNKLIAGVGTIVLCMGTPLWLFDLLQGSEFLPTSLGTHVLGLAIGLYGVRALGVERGTWWKAGAFVVAMIVLARFVTPNVSNVNVTFAIPPGMDRYFSGHLAYLAVMIGISCAYFWVVEMLLRAFVAKRSEAAAS
ncbi:MAG: hypothetical protein IT366_01830 [Candidatus Hydrogenedentes bacterium]|nr:hypothetical protein [Candidatus Hydrogenedentota bacterium]